MLTVRVGRCNRIIAPSSSSYSSVTAASSSSPSASATSIRDRKQRPPLLEITVTVSLSVYVVLDPFRGAAQKEIGSVSSFLQDSFAISFGFCKADFQPGRITQF